MKHVHSLIQQQIDYYQARASEYDEWYLRQGRYDQGPELNRQWFEELVELCNSLNRFKPDGKVLELACGTGLWTRQLSYHAHQLTAVDAVAEVIALNKQRMRSSMVEYIRADIFSWHPEELYDVIFFGFWLSHVPPQYFESFWQMISLGLKPGGRVFFVDSKYAPTSTALDDHLDGAKAGTVIRRLNDGQEHQIVRIFYKREQLERKLRRLGWNIKVNETPNYFLFGYGEPDQGNP